MNVKEFAERAGLSAHTIRYYDKLGLLGDVQRRANGHRYFSDRDIEWIGFVHRLRNTGMPVEQMLAYAQLRAQGEATMAQRQALLEQHAEALAARIALQQTHLKNLTDKIAWYSAQLARDQIAVKSLD